MDSLISLIDFIEKYRRSLSFALLLLYTLDCVLQYKVRFFEACIFFRVYNTHERDVISCLGSKLCFY